MTGKEAGEVRADGGDGGLPDRVVPRGVAGTNPAMTNCEAGAVRPPIGTFRQRLLASTMTSELVDKVERAGGWPVLMAIDAAQKTGQDWRPEADRLRKVNIDNWLRARFMLPADDAKAYVVRLPPEPPRWDRA